MIRSVRTGMESLSKRIIRRMIYEKTVIILTITLMTIFVLQISVAQETTSEDTSDEVSSAENAGEDFDLYEVLGLFEESENLEEFEQALNTEDTGVNNLDLNEDGEVDYIRVVEYAEEDTHVVVLQVELEEDDFQDVAHIDIEKTGEDDYVLQAIGAEELYGEDYIIEPETGSTDSTTTVVRVIFRPGYVVWVSPWRWRRYPAWWRPWRRVPRATYRARWARSVRRTRYRRTTVKRSARGRNIYTTQRKTSKKYATGRRATTQQQPPSTQQRQSPPTTTSPPQRSSPSQGRPTNRGISPGGGSRTQPRRSR